MPSALVSGCSSSNMKVCHITNDVAEASGVGAFVRQVDRELVRLGVDSRILTEIPQEPDVGPQPDIVHIHGIWLGLHHRALAWARKTGARVVWSTHGMTAPWCMHHKWWKKFPAWLLYQGRDLRSADLVHVTSENEVSRNKKLGVKNQVLVPLGSNLPEDGQAGNDLGDKREEEHSLLFVGRIYPVKAIDRLILAFAEVPESVRKNWSLRIVGPDQAGCQEQLQDLIASKCPEIASAVQFVGPRFGEDLDSEYARCDCLALVSHSENFGVTVVDAMAHGKPVVTSTGTPWNEVDGRCGWWVDNRPEILSKALFAMMTLSDAQRREMGVAGRRLVEEKYTWQAVGEQMLAAYRKLLQG